MSGVDFAMLAVLVLAGAPALLVVTSKNVVHSALYLVLALLGVAATFLLIGAEFLAWAQVLIYVGAVIVLILFGLMLTRAPIGPIRDDTQHTRPAASVSIALFAFLVTMIVATFGTQALPTNVTATTDLASSLYVEWAFPLLALGFLLTVALVGAIIIARQDEGDGPLPQDLEVEQIRTPGEPDTSAQPARLTEVL